MSHSICLFVSLSLFLYSLPFPLPLPLSLYISIHISILLSLTPPPSLSLSLYLSTYLSNYLFIYISRSIYLSVLFISISSISIIFPFLTLYIFLFRVRSLPFYLAIYKIMYPSLSLSRYCIYLSIYLTLFIISIYLTD